MVERPELDIDALIAPISPDRPAGEDLSYDVESRLDEYRREVNDPSLPGEDQKRADWGRAEELAQDALRNTSKHLRPAVRLLEALVQRYQFGGLAVGLQMVRRLVEECWDRLLPPIPSLPSEDDPAYEEVKENQERALLKRARELDWVDAQFPKIVWLAPVFGNPPVFSLLDYRKIVQPEAMEVAPPKEDFDRARSATDADQGRQVVKDLTDSIQEVDLLAGSLETKMAEAPSFVDLRRTLDRLRTLAGGAFGPEVSVSSEAAAAAGEPTEDAVSGGGQTGAAAPIANRDAAYRKLGEIANILKRLEPHSPIPYVLERAIRWGNMPFPDLLKEMVRDVNALAEVHRLVGIPESSSEG